MGGIWETLLPVHARTLSVTHRGLMHVQGDMVLEEIRQPAQNFRRRNSLVFKSFHWFHGRLVTSGQHLQHRLTVSPDLVVCNLGWTIRHR